MKRLAAFALALMLMLSLAGQASAKDMFEEEYVKDVEAVKLVRDTRKGGYDLLSTDELKKFMAGTGNVLLIDTMPGDAFRKEHVPAAVNFVFPIEDMDEWDTAKTEGKTQDDYLKLLGPDKSRPIVVYCGFVKCTRSHNGAVWARKLGYTNVKRYPGGIYAWKGAKNDVESAR